DKVKDTKAMAQVLSLLEAGQLPGGAGVMKKIFDGLAAKNQAK
ncbi:hypothetical protein JCM10213_004825, partial [Rhodosporidiobolus nylandii]